MSETDRGPIKPGLYAKYTIVKNETGEQVTDAFVLRPDRDEAARKALRAYALACEDLELENDLMAWLEDLEEQA